MTEHTAPPARPAGRPMVRAVVTVVVFGLLGPPIAGLVVIAGLAVFALSDGGKDAWAMFLAVAFNALWVAYLIGVIPALVVGIVFAVIDYRRRRSSFLMALLVGGVAGIVWWYLIAKGQPSDLDNWMIVGSLVATVVCWRICRRPAERNMGNAAA